MVSDIQQKLYVVSPARHHLNHSHYQKDSNPAKDTSTYTYLSASYSSQSKFKSFIALFQPCLFGWKVHILKVCRTNLSCSLSQVL